MDEKSEHLLLEKSRLLSISIEIQTKKQITQAIENNYEQTEATEPVLRYRPSYVPPASAAVKIVETLTVNVSGVKVGTTVLHKALGKDSVSKKDNIYATFDGAEKEFQFLCVFQQRFLKKF